MPDSARYRTHGRPRPEQEPAILVTKVDGRPWRHCPAPIFSILAKAFHEQVEQGACPEGAGNMNAGAGP